jgi:pimeloyl-ACP methyl ester carboxylesterase
MFGHSMGGNAAQLLASRRPKGLQGLVLVAPATPTPQDIPEPARYAQLYAYDNRETVLQTIAFLTHQPLDEKVPEQIIEDSLGRSAAAKLVWPTPPTKIFLPRWSKRTDARERGTARQLVSPLSQSCEVSAHSARL